MDWVGWTIGAVGLFVTIYALVKSRRSKCLSYATRSIVMVQDRVATIPELAVSFAGTPVDRLTATKILILNTGQSVIRQEDIAPADPLCVGVDEPGKVLKITVARTLGKANRVRVAGGDKAAFQFDYLAPSEGCVLNVLHTASASPRLAGTVIGGRLRQRAILVAYWNYKPFVCYVVALACFICGVALLRTLEASGLSRMWPLLALLGLIALGLWIGGKRYEGVLQRREAGLWEESVT